MSKLLLLYLHHTYQITRHVTLARPRVYKKFTHKLITVQAMAVIANDAVAKNGCVLFFYFIFRPFPLVTASLAVNNAAAAAAVIAPGFDIIHIYIGIMIIITLYNILIYNV